MKTQSQIFKLVGEDLRVSIEREFSTLRALRQFQRRNPYFKQATEYVLQGDQWERFVIHGKQVIPQSVLLNLLKSINPNYDTLLASLNPEQ